MAVTAEKSDYVASVTATPPIAAKASKGGYQPIDSTPTHTQGAAAGDINSTIDFGIVSAGFRLDMHKSSVWNSAYGAGAQLQVGWRAYNRPDGTTVAESANGLFSGLSVAAIGYRQWVEAPIIGAGLDADQTRLFEGAAVLFATVTGAVIPVGAKTVFRVTGAGMGD